MNSHDLTVTTTPADHDDPRLTFGLFLATEGYRRCPQCEVRWGATAAMLILASFILPAELAIQCAMVGAIIGVLVIREVIVHGRRL